MQYDAWDISHAVRQQHLFDGVERGRESVQGHDRRCRYGTVIFGIVPPDSPIKGWF
jgi:hypothetical protein